MLFRQLFDHASSTFTYLLADSESGAAVLIDTVFEQHLRDAALVDELGLNLRFTLDTHLHADHVTGAWLMKQRFGSQIVMSRHAQAKGVDREVDDGDEIHFGALSLKVLATPGHTDGCVSYVLGDQSMVFTGDALLIRGAGRTDFQQGNAEMLYRSVHLKLFELPDRTLVYPAHDYMGRLSSSIGEERRHNPRLGGQRSMEDFALYMQNLGLPHPKQIDIALPANQVCGKPDENHPAPSTPDWAPVFRNYAGVPELDPIWVAEHMDGLTLLDVREETEFSGELGHIPPALLVPLGKLNSLLSEIARDKPVVTICRSGGRSAQAVLMLQKAGFARVANLKGGMIRWRDAGLPCA